MPQFRPSEDSTSVARRLRNDPTNAERRLWWLLRENFAEWHFRRQVPIRGYYADFASHRAQLVVEADGGQHDPASDATRTRAIESEGYSVIRFWNHEILGNADGIAMAIASALHHRSPPPISPDPKDRPGDGPPG